MSSRTVHLACGAVMALALAAPRDARAQTRVRASSHPSAAGTHWIVDPVHSQIDFRVRHLLGRVRGTFVDWYGVLVTKDRDWTHGTVNVSAQTASLNTGNAYRDADLRSDRFFAVDSFPTLTFESTGIVATDSTVEVGGILTIKGHARQVLLTGQFHGIARDAEGHERIAFDASTRVNRRDFGMSLTQIVGAQTVIGDDVEITIAIEAVRTT
jgi:polyisoprenoid-binding protein YceI